MITDPVLKKKVTDIHKRIAETVSIMERLTISESFALNKAYNKSERTAFRVDIDLDHLRSRLARLDILLGNHLPKEEG